MPIPLPVERVLQRLGQNIALARRRRELTQAMLAQRMGASTKTVGRMEEGFPGTSLHHLARALHALGELDALEQLLESTRDTVGVALMNDRLPQRVRPPKADPRTEQAATASTPPSPAPQK